MATTSSATSELAKNADGKYATTTVETTVYENGAIAESKTVTTIATYGFKDSVRMFHSTRLPGGPKQRVSHSDFWLFRKQQRNLELDSFEATTAAAQAPQPTTPTEESPMPENQTPDTRGHKSVAYSRQATKTVSRTESFQRYTPEGTLISRTEETEGNIQHSYALGLFHDPDLRVVLTQAARFQGKTIQPAELVCNWSGDETGGPAVVRVTGRVLKADGQPTADTAEMGFTLDTVRNDRIPEAPAWAMEMLAEFLNGFK